MCQREKELPRLDRGLVTSPEYFTTLCVLGMVTSLPRSTPTSKIRSLQSVSRCTLANELFLFHLRPRPSRFYAETSTATLKQTCCLAVLVHKSPPLNVQRSDGRIFPLPLCSQCQSSDSMGMMFL